MRPPLTFSFQRPPSVVPSLLAMVAAVMMLFGQSLAVGAVQSSSGIWIEVCGGDGTKMVQTEAPSPTSDCSHCDYCVVQFSANSFGPPAPFLFSPSPVFTAVQFITVSKNSTPGAEQFWAANRGPPLASEANMTSMTALWAAMTIPAQRGNSWL
ncbi:MAG: DUF2946 family protein [Rhodobacteraceae bacterium]|nr:DUF2946 family protein [Paracoccaceae bacterium]